MKLFDAHTHCFPDALAGKALPKLAEVSGCIYHGSGTYASLCEKERAAGADGFLILHIATKPEQTEPVNRFAASCRRENILCFGSVYPTAENAAAALDSIKALGLDGVKLHPDYQNFFVDDPAVFPVYARAAELGLPITFHAGRDPYSPDVVHCTPQMLAEVSDRFPTLKIIAAHMGGMEMDGDVERCLVGRENVWLDTAFATRFLSPARCCALIRAHGVERVLFATDFPWSTIEAERTLLEQSGLSADELEQICHKNAERFFGLSL